MKDEVFLFALLNRIRNCIEVASKAVKQLCIVKVVKRERAEVVLMALAVL